MSDRAAHLVKPGPAIASPPSARVNHLLAVARAAFIADGFAGVSIDGIARDSGVSKETIYRHFASKQALFRAALESFASDFTGRITATQHDAAPAGGGLAAMARAILDAAVDGGLLSPLWLAAGVAGLMPEFAEELTLAQRQRLGPVRHTLEVLAQAQGIAAKVPTELALDFGSLAVEGPALLIGFDGPDAEARAVIAARVAQLFEHGLLAIGQATTSAPPALTNPQSVSDKVAPHIRTLLDVAALHFLQAGYHRANLAEIGAEARVGRGTLYRHFGSKDGLFSAVLRDLADQLADAAEVPALLLVPPFDETLTQFVAAAASVLASPASIAFHRAAITAARRDPELTCAVHDRVRAPWVEPLSTWIEAVSGAADARWLAGQLLVLALKGNRLFAAGDSLPAEQIPAHARRVVAIFLHGFAASLKPPVTP